MSDEPFDPESPALRQQRESVTQQERQYDSTPPPASVPPDPDDFPEEAPEEEFVKPVPSRTGSSLRERVRERAEELANRTTQVFPVPMFDSVLAVELKAIPWQRTERSIRRNQRVQDQAMLYTAGDELVAATTGVFYEITGETDEETGYPVIEEIEDASSWYELATTLAGKTLRPAPNARPEVFERVALVAMCTDQGVMSLNTTYRQWLNGDPDAGLAAVKREVTRDFQPPGRQS